MICAVSDNTANLHHLAKYYGRCVVSLCAAGPSQWWHAVKRITGQSQKNQLNNLSADDNYGTIADNINNFFHSVSADLAPLDLSLMPAATDPVPQEFVIELHQVENKLAKLQPNKACWPDNIPNWFWRDFFCVVSRTTLCHL